MEIYTQKIKSLLTEFLEPYISTLHDFREESNYNTIQLEGKKNKDDTSYFILLRLGISFDNQETYISNIFLPKEDRGKGIGLSLISFLYEITKSINHSLVLVDMTDSFKEVMLKRGAKPTLIYDCLQIVETTNLQ